MNTIDIMPGAKIFKNDSYSVLFGCPPEIIKFIMNQSLEMPSYIVLADSFQKFGTLQNATEFPLYHFLFVLKKFFEGKRLNILGTKEEVLDNKELLRLSLLGPTKEEFGLIGESKYFEQLYTESRALSLKNEKGEELPIEGFINFMYFKNGFIQTKNFQLIHKDLNVYEIDGNIIDINFNTPQNPPYDLKPDFIPLKPLKYGIDVLGGGSGFTPKKPCSALLLNYNTDYMLIDCLPYIESAINARGISKEQIKSIYLTHIHDDHCNIFPLLLFNNKIKFLGTKEIFWMACKKLSLATHMDIEKFYSYFEFIELIPYQDNDFYGFNIIPHYTVHSIPTIGATFEMHHNIRNKKTIVFGGDNKALPQIEEMVAKGIVTQEKFDYIKKLYTESHDLLFVDGVKEFCTETRKMLWVPKRKGLYFCI